MEQLEAMKSSFCDSVLKSVEEGNVSLSEGFRITEFVRGLSEEGFGLVMSCFFAESIMIVPDNALSDILAIKHS